MLILALAVTPVWGAGQNEGERCYVFWASQCFQIRDARTRDITHHVLITRGPQSLPGGEDCAGSAEQRVIGESREKLLKRFNDILEDEEGCQTLDSAPLKAFSTQQAALRAYRRLARQGQRKEIHELAPPELP